MGSFNTICGVSRHIVTCGEPVMLIPVVPNTTKRFSISPGCYQHDRYVFAMHLPLEAVYDDYGNFDIKEGDAYEAFKSMVVENRVCDEADKLSSEELFGKLRYQDLMHEEGLFIKPANSWCGDEKAQLMFMVIKRKVYDLIVAEFDRTASGWWNNDYISQSHANIRREFATIANTEPMTKEERKAKLDAVLASDLFKDSPDMATDLIRSYMSNPHSSYTMAVDASCSPYNMYNLTDTVVRLTAKNVEDHLNLRKFYSMLCQLNIEINVQQYGSQDNDHLYHADLMTRIVVAGAENDENRDYPLKINPKLVVDLDVKAVQEYVSANKWKEVPDLIRDETGNLVPSMKKYGEFNEISNIVEFKEV